MLSYSIETYRFGDNEAKFVAITADEIKCMFTTQSGAYDFEKKVRPLAIRDTRDEAVSNLMDGVTALTHIDSKDHVIINIRHHDEYVCYYCSYLPKYAHHTEWLDHYEKQHKTQRELSVKE